MNNKIQPIINKIKDISKTLVETEDWKEYIVGEIFNCQTTKPLIHTKKGKYNYVTRSAINNGVSDFVDSEGYILNKSNCITIGAEGAVAFYQNKDFVSGVKVYTLRNENLTKNNALFIVTILNKKSSNYSYSNARILEKIKQEKITLPTKNNQPNWEYMDKFIENLRIKMNLDISNDLKENKLVTHTLINDIINKIKTSKKTLLNIKEWKPFYIRDIFEVFSTKTRELTKYKFGKIPFISGVSINNGVERFVSTDEELEKGNCITVSSLDCSAFYQKNDFIGRGHGVVQRLYNKNLTRNNALFICSIIKKLGKKYNYSNQCFLKQLKEEKITLPTKNNQPDWEYMDNYIKEIKKNINLD